MGTVQSDVAGVEETDTGSDYVLVSTEAEKTLSFDPSQSYLVAFCINRQTSPRFRHRQLNDTVVNDSFKVMSALHESGALPRDNSNLIQASIEPQDCTFQGMKKAFQREARKVGEGGAFFLHFSGHGIRVNNDQFGLAPVDFDYTTDTYVTASVLSQWLREAQCKAKFVLFTIDCCYAGGIAEALTGGSDILTPYPGLYVMASCTANEVSVIIGTLGNSIFCYFLAHSISTTHSSPGQFPIQRIFDKCKKLSIALSSLLLSYEKTSGLHWRTMQPELTHSTLSETVLQFTGEGSEDEQVDAGIMRFNYATELYDFAGGREGVSRLDQKCLTWLEMTYSDSNGGLVQLKEEGVLGRDRCLTDTVLCCMLRSVASIQLACDQSTVATPNLYITSYMHVVAAIDIVQCGAQFQEREFALGLAYYLDCLLLSGLNMQPLKQIYHRLLGNLRAKLAAKTEKEMTDSGDMVSVIITKHFQDKVKKLSSKLLARIACEFFSLQINIFIPACLTVFTRKPLCHVGNRCSMCHQRGQRQLATCMHILNQMQCTAVL